MHLGLLRIGMVPILLYRFKIIGQLEEHNRNVRMAPVERIKNSMS